MTFMKFNAAEILAKKKQQEEDAARQREQDAMLESEKARIEKENEIKRLEKETAERNKREKEAAEREEKERKKHEAKAEAERKEKERLAEEKRIKEAEEKRRLELENQKLQEEKRLLKELNPNTIFVGNTKIDDTSELDYAVRKSSSGTIIKIREGTYYLTEPIRKNISFVAFEENSHVFIERKEESSSVSIRSSSVTFKRISFSEHVIFSISDSDFNEDSVLYLENCTGNFKINLSNYGNKKQNCAVNFSNCDLKSLSSKTYGKVKINISVDNSKISKLDLFSKTTLNASNSQIFCSGKQPVLYSYNQNASTTKMTNCDICASKTVHVKSRTVHRILWSDVLFGGLFALALVFGFGIGIKQDEINKFLAFFIFGGFFAFVISGLYMLIRIPFQRFTFHSSNIAFEYITIIAFYIFLLFLSLYTCYSLNSVGIFKKFVFTILLALVSLASIVAYFIMRDEERFKESICYLVMGILGLVLGSIGFIIWKISGFIIFVSAIVAFVSIPWTLVLGRKYRYSFNKFDEIILPLIISSVAVGICLFFLVFKLIFTFTDMGGFLKFLVSILIGAGIVVADVFVTKKLMYSI